MTDTGAPRDSIAAEITVTAGKPDSTELAAATTVLSAMLEEMADAQGAVMKPAPSAWERSQRAIRNQLHPGPGAWRGFS